MNSRRIRVLIAKPGLAGHDALEEDVDVIGLSSMAGSHVPYCKRLKELMIDKSLDDKLWIIGGVIPMPDQQALKDVGLDGIFPAGTRLDDIVDFINEKCK